MWKTFSLSDKEGLNVDLVNTSQQPENILAAKFLTSRVLNMDAVARTFKPLWKTRQSFTVQDLGGLVEKVAASDDECGGENCMRVRVRMEVNRPLCRGRLVNLDEGKQGWVAFRYERLPNFCYWCGCLDHVEKDCDIGLQQRHSSTKEEFQYGAWLRATSDCPPRKTVVIVPGNQPKSRANSTRADHPSHQPATEMEDLNCERNEKGKASDVTARDLENDMEIEPNPGFPLQRLVPSPAGSHDLYQLELSRAWEPGNDSSSNQPWRLTCFYGAPETHLREHSWNLLRTLNGQHSLPWCCVGDFNEIVRNSEKCGRRSQSERQMQGFRAVIDDYGFLDLGFRGFPFTWCNNRGSPLVQVTEKIQRSGDELMKWSRIQFGNITKLLKEKTEQLRQAEMDSTLGFGHDTVISIRREVSDLLLKEEKMWKQRSRDSWLKEGDRNTKYFHNCASHRKRRNTISLVRMDFGELVTDANLIGKQFTEYYQALFTATPLEEVEVLLDSIQLCVTQEMNQTLTAQFTKEEVLTAMKQMGPLKAPGPDGMPPIFYQSYWHVVGKDVAAVVLYCLQSGKVGFMALKLDMSKAYDRVEWGFLKQVMVTLFPSEGLRQGDPISPYLFLLCEEGLTGLLKKATLQEASEKTRGSFAWRSILKTKDLIKSGLNWRVGDGTQIPIKGSNWLLDEGHRRQEDKLFWFDTRDGKYSMHSGYKLLCKDARASQPESSRQWDPNPLWKRIWGARVPAKVKSFLWRACHDSLPIKSGLFKRQVTSTPICDLCRYQREDSLHALWVCPVVAQVWSLAPKFSELQKSAPVSINELVRQVTQSDSDLLLEKFAVTSWLLWHKRNQDRLHIPSEPYNQVLILAHAFLNEYLSVTTEEKTEKPKPHQVRWKPLSSNFYKVNFDGAIFKESNTGGLGVVIRDYTGMVIATLSQKVHGTHIVEMIEALAARKAILFAKEVGVFDAEFEGDAETVIRDL
uniref:CCHC-type domain-containing protein n=1 Tax=Fagus sylvatica TaxID=28930 RepID=A0A2N9IQD1_FAGSY